MQTIKEFITKYYKNHENILLSCYPGLKVQRLIEEYCEFYKLKPYEVYLGRSILFLDQINLGIPLEYIQRNAYFYKSNFFVDERVLIPRSETEILVEDSIQFINSNYNSNFRIAEVGVGSFCIGLTIAMEVPKPLKIWAGDIEQNALTVSKINYFKLRAKINSKTEVELVLSDRLQGTDCKYDFIVSNPPYIKFRADRPGVHEQADQFEPHTALFLDDQIFDEWFEELFKDTSAKLNVNGAFFMEGHEDSLLQLEQIAMKYFSKTEIKKDYTGRVRFLYAYK